MESGLRRSGQYMKLARQIFAKEGVPVDITWLGQVESAWKPKAMSWACGLRIVAVHSRHWARLWSAANGLDR